MAKTAKATASQPISSQSVEASIAKALAPIHEVIKRNHRHEEAAYAGIEEFEGNEFGLGQHKAYGAMHIGEIADEQKLADGNAQEMSEYAEEQVRAEAIKRKCMGERLDKLVRHRIWHLHRIYWHHELMFLNLGTRIRHGMRDG